MIWCYFNIGDTIICQKIANSALLNPELLPLMRLFGIPKCANKLCNTTKLAENEVLGTGETSNNFVFASITINSMCPLNEPALSIQIHFQGCTGTNQETPLIEDAEAFCWQVAHPFTNFKISILGHHTYEQTTAFIADIP